MNEETEASIRKEWDSAKSRPGAEGGPFQVAGDVYADSTRLQLEKQRVFGRSWLPVVRESELRVTGDFVTVDLVGTPVLVIRTEGGAVRALLNVCTHRGSQVVRHDCGRLEQLQCPYHHFTYSLDGTLVSRPEPGSFSSAHDGAMTVLDAMAWGGWIWVRLESGEVGLDHFLGPHLIEELKEWPFENVTRVHRTVHCGEFDWKIGVEAFLESLHLPAIHGRTAHPLLDFRRTAQAALGVHSRMSTPFRSTGAYGPKGPFGQAAEQAGVGIFPELKAVQRESNFSYLLFPSTILNLLPTHFTLFRLLPTGLGACRLEHELYVTPTLSSEAEAYGQSLIPGYETLLKEDLENLAWIQKGLASGGSRQLNLGSHERRILHFRETLDAWMAQSEEP